MTEHAKDTPNTAQWAIPMRARSPEEGHRAATPLELFFDLVFVVAIAQAGSSLHHALAEGHATQGVFSFSIVFFAIWWAWMNFTWFASAYDTDDVPYRLATFVQLIGALIIAAGIPQAFDELRFPIVTLGYSIMRLSLIGQWLRAGLADNAHRASAFRYAIGLGLCQIGWIGLLFASDQWLMVGFVILVLAELLVPVWAERVAPSAWHAGHIAERYGLFTIIVLGESILAASLAIQAALQDGQLSAQLAIIIAGGVLIVFAMWWLYFDRPMDDLLTSLRTAFIWGYGHLFVFAAAAAVGAGLAVAVDQATHHAEISATAAGAAVAIPVAVYLLVLWLLHERVRAQSGKEMVLFPATALLILISVITGQAVLITGLLLAGLLVVKLVGRYRESG